MKKFKNILYLEIDNSKELNTIMIPGFLQTNKTYQNLFKTISQYSNIYFIELPGFGITEQIDRVVNLDYYVILLKEFIESLKLKNVILFGHSFGGRVIVKYESIYNSSKRLILLDSAGCTKRTIKTKFKIFKYKLLKQIYKTFKLKHQYKNLINNSGTNDYKILDSISKQTFNNIIKESTTKYLKKIQTPSLILWGELDKDTPLKDGILMNKKITNSTLIKIDNVGHFPHLENPILVNNIIDNFYRGGCL